MVKSMKDSSNQVMVPPEFQIPNPNVYPSLSDCPMIEEFFFDFYNKSNLPKGNRLYLPVFWTSHYVENDYGNDKSAIAHLQAYLDTLDPADKYFTVVQYADGILNDLSHLDIKVFSSGGVGDIPLPLLCKPRPKENLKKDIFGSFIGVIQGRHPIREKMRDVLAGDEAFFISESIGGNERAVNAYAEIMERSYFSLAPRGYGKTSFRLYEALQLGSIPVYLYDDPWLPFADSIDWSSFCVLIHENDIGNLSNTLKSISQEKAAEMLEAGQHAYRNFFNFEACSIKIMEHCHE